MKQNLFFIISIISTSNFNYCQETFNNQSMQFLYAPWRNSYNNNKDNYDIKESCPFCRNIKENDDKKNFVLHRNKNNIIQLNLFPYNKGHILIVPLKHKRDLHEFESEEIFELMELISKSSKILQETLKADGINVGINIGKPAGASIPGHLHVHILPRWQDDNYFLSMLAQTRIISIDLNSVYEILKPKFDCIRSII